MTKKGRVVVGADADITVFDLSTIIDNATFEKPAQTSTGIHHVLVGGTFVVKGTAFVEGTFPGRGVKSEGIGA
jgi:N-acyl-D-aspartate/D-glutamate deacylase